MIDLAICMTLQNEGYGIYGQNLFFGTSPILDTGTVTSQQGTWVNANTIDIKGDLYTDQITISSRHENVLTQGRLMLRLLNLINNKLPTYNQLTCQPITDITYTSIRTHPATAIDLDAIDHEGRWVKSIRFQIDYKLDYTPDYTPDTTTL